MTERDEAIRARCEAATPGPWSIQENRLMCAPVIEAGYKHEIAKVLFYRGSEDPYVFPNAAFIANAREDIHYLLDRVACLESALAEAQRRAEAATKDLEALMKKCHGSACDLCFVAGYEPGYGPICPKRECEPKWRGLDGRDNKQ